MTGQEQGMARVDKCPTCGSEVEVVSSDEGTCHFKPARSLYLLAAINQEARAI